MTSHYCDSKRERGEREFLSRIKGSRSRGLARWHRLSPRKGFRGNNADFSSAFFLLKKIGDYCSRKGGADSLDGVPTTYAAEKYAAIKSSEESGLCRKNSDVLSGFKKYIKLQGGKISADRQRRGVPHLILPLSLLPLDWD